MPSKPKTVEHIGRVDEITLNDIRVIITNQSACASCHARGACTVSDSQDKIVVITKQNHNFFVGEEVKVLLQQSLGFKALFLGYLLPLVVVITALVTLNALGFSDGLSGLLALAALLPYYLLLYLLRGSISRVFTFDIEKLS
jgi:sigma-E factor negative regulatory protein RseC